MIPVEIDALKATRGKAFEKKKTSFGGKAVYAM